MFMANVFKKLFWMFVSKYTRIIHNYNAPVFLVRVFLRVITVLYPVIFPKGLARLLLYICRTSFFDFFFQQQ
jgi:hypothetical protein